ncbi:MAG: exosortase/archaeosortase family protein [Pirellulales bacterium]|nr:exosortase/archaeosortase family protein [Pirellulales bacterium]
MASTIAATPNCTPAETQRRIEPSWVAAALVLGGSFLWAYWPTLTNMVTTWSREPDYSHGFLVVPFAAYLLWARRDRMPTAAGKLSWLGLLPIALAAVVRVVASYLSFEPLDGYTIPLWVAGVVWFLWGPRVMLWALPVTLFLAFMVPLPWRIEYQLSEPMQRIATAASCWLLQLLGQPAVARGLTIVVDEAKLEVEQACSGLRLFMGFFAVSAAYVLIVRRPLWQSIVIMLAAAPIAIVSNILRITATGLVYRYSGGEWARKVSHDVAGWAMILLASALLTSLLWYLNRLVVEVRAVRTYGLSEGDRAPR